MKLQDRYLFKKLCKSFLVILGVLLFLFLLIDYALQAKTTVGGSLTLFATYYAAKLSSFASILLPFAFLLALLFVLNDLNNKRQWLALQACKITYRRLLRPFLLAALLISAFLWINNQYFARFAMLKPLEKKKTSYFSSSSEKVRALKLKAGGYIFFQSFNPDTKTLTDIFWLPEKDTTLWHMNFLQIGSNPVVAYDAKELAPDSQGAYFLKEVHDTLILPSFRFELPDDTEELLDTKEQSLLLLAKKACLFPQNDQEAKASTHFFMKLLTPLLPLLLLFAAVPSALRFTKNSSSFPLFAFWSAFYIVIVALIDASFFLGESLLLNPLLAITIPLLVVLALGGFLWKRLI